MRLCKEVEIARIRENERAFYGSFAIICFAAFFVGILIDNRN